MNLATFLSSLDAKKPEFRATFSIKYKMTFKKCDLENYFFIFILIMVNMLNFMNLVSFLSSLDAKKPEFWATFRI